MIRLVTLVGVGLAKSVQTNEDIQMFSYSWLQWMVWVRNSLQSKEKGFKWIFNRYHCH